MLRYKRAFFIKLLALHFLLYTGQHHLVTAACGFGKPAAAFFNIRGDAHTGELIFCTTLLLNAGAYGII
ncbi:MAG: hypothetical protein C4538_07415 [Nitrospiraceae bacterium]|nr:MAG: hypothetical protein C4538_07415 [Nitrospiraceae bacterium]